MLAPVARGRALVGGGSVEKNENGSARIPLLRRAGLTLTVLVGGLLATSPAMPQTPPFDVGGDPLVDPTEFEITTFASGLDAPVSMQSLPDGSLAVGTQSGILRLVDADDDGVADGPGTLLYGGGSGIVSALRRVGDLFFVMRDQTFSVLRAGAAPADPLTLEASFDFQLVFPWQHLSHTLAVRELSPGIVELYFNLGSKVDNAATVDPVPLVGDLAGVLAGDSIYRFRVDDTQAPIALSGLERIASGVRNAFGMVFDPTSGDLWFQDNSADGPNPPFELAVDELNRIAAADLGGAVEDFGFPNNYFAYRTNLEVGSGGIDPILTFQPIPPPAGSESDGAAEIAFAPPGFPPGLRDGLFVGFHGVFTSAGLSNPLNPLVWVDPAGGTYFHFVENDEAGVGHPDGLLATQDALYVSDFSSVDGFPSPGSTAGRIYRIRALPSPVPGLTPIAGALAVGLLLVTASASFAWRGVRAR